MLFNIYLIVCSYFVLGGILTFIINNNKTDEVKKNNWLKLFVYFLIINILLFSIYFENKLFLVVSILIVSFSIYEVVYFSFP